MTLTKLPQNTTLQLMVVMHGMSVGKKGLIHKTSILCSWCSIRGFKPFAIVWFVDWRYTVRGFWHPTCCQYVLLFNRVGQFWNPDFLTGAGDQVIIYCTLGLLYIQYRWYKIFCLISCVYFVVFFTFALTAFVKGKKVKKNCKFFSLIFMNFKKSFKRWKSSVGP